MSDFQFMINHDILNTKSWLFKDEITENDLCYHRRTGTFGLGGGGGGGDLIARKKYTVPESMCCANALKSP